MHRQHFNVMGGHPRSPEAIVAAFHVLFSNQEGCWVEIRFMRSYWTITDAYTMQGQSEVKQGHRRSLRQFKTYPYKTGCSGYLMGPKGTSKDWVMITRSSKVRRGQFRSLQDTHLRLVKRANDGSYITLRNDCQWSEAIAGHQRSLSQFTAQPYN